MTKNKNKNLNKKEKDNVKQEKVFKNPTKKFSGKLLIVILTLAMVLGSFALLIYYIIQSILRV